MADTGAVKSWGLNTYAQLGSGDNITRSMPGNFSASLKGILEVRGGNTATCVLLSVDQDFNLQCVGSNTDGQLGKSVEETSYSRTLLRVADLLDVPITIAPTLAPSPPSRSSAPTSSGSMETAARMAGCSGLLAMIVPTLAIMLG